MQSPDEKLMNLYTEIQRGIYYHPRAIERVMRKDIIRREFDIFKNYYTYSPDELQLVNAEVSNLLHMLEWPVYGGIVPTRIVNWVNQGLTVPEVVEAFHNSLPEESRRVINVMRMIERANTPAHLSWQEYRDELFRRKNE